MISRLLVISALIAAACESKSAKQVHPLEVEYEQWLREKIERMNHQVQSAHNELQNHVTTLIAQSTDELDQITDTKASVLKNSIVNKMCLEEALEQLAVVKDSSKKSFLTCTNLTVALGDIGLIGWEVVNFVSKTLIYLDSVMNGLSDCTWSYYLPPIKCYISYVYTAIADMSKFTSDVRSLLHNIAANAEDVKKQIAYCSNGPKNNTVMLVKNAVHNAVQCNLTNK